MSTVVQTGSQSFDENNRINDIPRSNVTVVEYESSEKFNITKMYSYGKNSIRKV